MNFKDRRLIGHITVPRPLAATLRMICLSAKSLSVSKVIFTYMERELRERKERYRTECEGLPHGWSREVVIRKSGHSAGRVDIYYYRYGHTH